MNKKTVLVIPGSYWQIPIIKKIKENGCRVLTVNPYEDSPAFPYADDYLIADIFDKEKVLKYCKDNNIDAIISEECDIAMPILAYYGKELGLSTISTEEAHLYTDKCAMRDFCKENNLYSPDYKMCHSKKEAIDFFESKNEKLIIKPLDSNSSRGVFTINSVEDIEKYFDESLSFSRAEKAVLLEEYIDGIEFTVDGIKTPEKHFSLAISEKRHFKHNANIASELYFTYDNPNFDYDLLRQTNDKFVELSGLKFGLTHAEYKCKDGKFYLIEIAARGGGNLISSNIVPYMSGFDNYQYLINCSLNKIESKDFNIAEEYKERASVLKFFETPGNGGIVKKIEGLDFLENNPNINAYNLYFKEGDRIENAKNDAARIGYYIACCENKNKLDFLMDEISKKIKILLDKGNNNIQIYKDISNELKLKYINNCNKEITTNLYEFSNANEIIKKIQNYADFFVINEDVNAFTKGGFIAFYSNNYETKQAFITLFCVSESNQHIGLGTELMNECIRFCKEKGMEEIKLEVRNNNLKAINFYKKNGFDFAGDCSEKTKYMKKSL